MEIEIEIDMLEKVVPTRKPAYWWNDETATAREECFKARRKVKRARNQPKVASLVAELRKCKSTFKVEVKPSKRECFKELRDGAERDPWGKACKMVMKAVKNPKAPQPISLVLMETVFTTLFSAQEAFTYNIADSHQPTPQVSTEEVLAMDSTAPELGRVPSFARKTAVKSKPNVFATLFPTASWKGILRRLEKAAISALAKTRKATRATILASHTFYVRYNRQNVTTALTPG